MRVSPDSGDLRRKILGIFKSRFRGFETKIWKTNSEVGDLGQL
jgi:hypothetical protein